MIWNLQLSVSFCLYADDLDMLASSEYVFDIEKCWIKYMACGQQTLTTAGQDLMYLLNLK